MGFFGDIWGWIKDQIPTWDEATDWHNWIPSWDNITSWRYWLGPTVALGAIIVGYSTGWLGSAWDFTTDYFVDVWNDLWYWMYKILGWGK